MSTQWLRLLAAFAAFGCAVAGWQMVAVTQATGHMSALASASLLFSALAGIAAVGLTFAPTKIIQRLSTGIAAWRNTVRSAEISDRRRLGFALSGVALVTYALIAGRLLLLPDDPADDDQRAFLEAAAAVHASGGPLTLIGDLYGGRFAEANRHPLYIALLSVRPTVSFGRGLSAAFGLTTLLVLWVATLRRWGVLVAGIAGILLGVNMSFCLFSTRVVCDVLMVLWGGGIFLLASHATSKGSLQREAAIGGLLAVAYLTKGTGVLMLAGVLVWKVLLCLSSFRARAATELKQDPCLSPRHASRWPHARGIARELAAPLLVIVLTWIVVSSPLLIRNVRMYGKPLYNVNSWLLFVDEYEHPVPLSKRESLGGAARAYWQSHTLGDIAQREITGVVWEAFILLRMLGPYPLDDSRVLFGLPLAACALIAIAARPRPEHLLLAIWTGLFMGVFAWYVPIAAGERFLLPLLAPVLLCASEGFVRLLSTRRRLPGRASF